MVHFVQFDTETDLGQGIIGPEEPEGSEGNPDENSGPFWLLDQQINWLKKDLAGVNRKKTRWIIVSVLSFLQVFLTSHMVSWSPVTVLGM